MTDSDTPNVATTPDEGGWWNHADEADTDHDDGRVGRQDAPDATDASVLSTTDAPEAHLEDLAPSAKAVFLALHLDDGPSTDKDIAEITRLSQRTVRDAFDQLLRMGLVTDRPSLHDARQTWYSLTEDAPEAIPE